MKEKESEFIVSTEELKKNQEKAKLRDEMNAEKEAMELSSKRALKFIAVIGIVLITIAITQFFYVGRVEVNDNSTMTCRGGLIEACLTRSIK